MHMTSSHIPERAPTPRPAMKRPMVNWTMEKVVPVWTATPIVKIADQMRMEPLRPKRSDVNACPSAPLGKC